MKFFIAILVASLSSINFSISMENFPKDIRFKGGYAKNITNSREIIIIDDDENENKKRKSSDELNHPNDKKRKTLSEDSNSGIVISKTPRIQPSISTYFEKPNHPQISPQIKQTNRKNEESAEELNKRGEMCRDNPCDKKYSYSEPFNLFTKAAEMGSAPAQFNLAKMYEDGRGASKNEAKALELYKKSASQGWHEAQCMLAGIYRYGLLGISQDIDKAFILYSKLANQGNPRAQNNLAEMYENGLGVLKDGTKAINLYKKASARGLPAAQRNLTRLQEKITF